MALFRAVIKEEEDSNDGGRFLRGFIVVDLRLDGRQEVGGQAFWTVSSSKSNCGIEQMRDNNLETFWQ